MLPFFIEIKNLKIGRRTDSPNFKWEKQSDLERTKVCIILALVFGLKTSEIYLVTSKIIATLLSKGKFHLESQKSKKALYLNKNCLNLLLEFLNKAEVSWSLAFSFSQKNQFKALSLGYVIDLICLSTRKEALLSKARRGALF